MGTSSRNPHKLTEGIGRYMNWLCSTEYIHTFEVIYRINSDSLDFYFYGLKVTCWILS